MPQDYDQEIDITDKVCPLTFVHTRLTIDSMSPGKVLAVRLRKGEALENVPRSVKELGHEILSLAPTKNMEDVYRLRILIV
jgi:tRNA 2-thiouridine synthesizing protein A